MESVVQTITQEVLNHHLSAFADADVDEILKDYDEDSELLTPDGAFKGLNAIRSFFDESFKIFPKGSALELKQYIVRDEIIYVTWSGESSFVSIPMGTDTFIFQEDKIRVQTVAAQIVFK